MLMLSNKTIELIRKSLDLSIINAQLDDSKSEYKKAKEEFIEYIYDLKDKKD